MKLQAQVAKIVGPSKEEIWGQVFESDNLFLVVEVSVPEEHEAAVLGKEIINTLSSQFSQLPTVNLKNLKNLVKSIRDRDSELQIPEKTELNIILCALVDNFFYLLIFGEGKAFLKRKDRVAVLLESKGSGSGILKKGDLLILTSAKFNQTISYDTLKSTLNLPFEERAENLAPVLHASENSFGAAALILRFAEREELVEEEEKEEKEEKAFSKTTPFRDFLAKLKRLAAFLKFRPSILVKRKLSPQEQTKKTVLTAALILTALLLISVAFGFGNKKKNLQQEKFQAVFEKATHKFEEGKALIPLNTQKSRELLKEAKGLLEEALDEFKKGSKERRTIEALLNEAEEALKETERIYKLSEVPLFFDPVFLKDQAFGEDLGLYREGLAILDKKQDALYYLSLKEKSGKILAGGEKLEGSKSVGIHGGSVYVLSNEGIVEISINDQSSEVKVEKDDDWGQIVDLVAYRGNVYLLDKKGAVIKYLRTDEGFAKRDYLAPGDEFDFSSATSMAIDGDVWVAKSGEVLKFSLGARQEFSPQGLERGLSGQLLIYTDEENENIYILEKRGRRIVVLNKTGEYQAQYEWEKLAEADDLVVSEKEGKILVLVEGRIYGIDIKN